MASGGQRDLTKESFWRRQLERHSASKLSVRGWCLRHNLAEPTFYWWRKELARRDVEQSAFVPVHGVEDEAPHAGAAIEIVLAGQRCIRVIGRVDRQALTDVLAVMGPRSC